MGSSHNLDKHSGVENSDEHTATLEIRNVQFWTTAANRTFSNLGSAWCNVVYICIYRNIRNNRIAHAEKTMP